MDTLDQARLDNIVKLEPVALTEADKAFLRARVTYLTPKQKEIYAKVIKANPAKVEPVADDMPSLRELKTRAKNAGLAHKGVSKEDLDTSVRTADGAEY